jgi:hypothetical protein
VIETQLRTLEFLTVKDKHEGKLTKTQIRQALNEHLKDFLHILEDNRSKTQGKEEWHFTLKLWSKDTQKNLEQFEIEWERLRPEKSKQQEKTLRETVAGKTPKPEDETYKLARNLPPKPRATKATHHQPFYQRLRGDTATG